ncbi:MAG TPA: maleylpyruvate isomerase family mycothiol-dependent enzyme [Acidimicrobiales bacterium]
MAVGLDDGAPGGPGVDDPGSRDVRDFVAEALVTVESAPVPPRLRDRVLAAALASRPAGRPPGTEPLSPIEAYRRTVGELDEVLADLDADGWAARVDRDGWTVQGLVGHLIAVDRRMGARLGVDEPPADPDADHLAVGLDSVAAQEGRDPAATLHDWRAVTRRVVDALAADPPGMGERVAFHRVDFRWGSLLVARTLEVWTHTDDIRVATGLTPVAPDAARLALMTDLTVRTLPHRLARQGAGPFTGTARIVLTGPGGGAWTQPLAVEPDDAEPDDAEPTAGATAADGTPTDTAAPPVVRLVADAVAFCRLAAGRLDPGELDVTVAGDPAVAAAVLASAAAFAV